VKTQLQITALLLSLFVIGCARVNGATPLDGPPDGTNAKDAKPIAKITKTDAEWRKLLTPEQYAVLREKDTERAFTGVYWNNHRPGKYACAGCSLELFSAKTKFESGTGWPSFWQPLTPQRVILQRDADGQRMEVLCARCGGHLGHVFDDGPQPTGQRYCMNSVALKFLPQPADAGKKDKSKKAN
jgi:peptide-methionine (R)-S-oxide reductase